MIYEICMSQCTTQLNWICRRTRLFNVSYTKHIHQNVHLFTAGSQFYQDGDQRSFMGHRLAGRPKCNCVWNSYCYSYCDPHGRLVTKVFLLIEIILFPNSLSFDKFK